MMREKNGSRSGSTSRPFTVARGPVPRMPRATVVRDRLSPNRFAETNTSLFRSVRT